MLYTQMVEELKNGQADKVVELTKQALAEGLTPKEIINDGLMVGMNVVGQLFKDNEMFVPEVLMASRAMTAGIEVVKPLLTGADMESKGICVFATVQGDLHDIGKRLVTMMMESSGYEIIDLGVDVSPTAIVDAVKEHNADIVGMSAMLTTTMQAMEATIKALQEAGLDNVKVMIGGAPVNAAYAKDIGGHYSPDASSAIELANSLMNK